jgi:hypothetical protein
MSKAGKNRGRDGRSLPTVDVSAEYREVERRAYHERLRCDRAARDEKDVKDALREAAQQKGWRVTERKEK